MSILHISKHLQRSEWPEGIILRGAPARLQVVFGTLAGNFVECPSTLVLGEGAKDHTRGRMCSPPRNIPSAAQLPASNLRSVNAANLPL